MAIYPGLPRSVNEKHYDAVYDCSDNATMLYWKKATKKMMLAYSTLLEGLGFEKHQELETPCICSATYCKEQLSVHVYYLKKTAELRVIAQNNAILPTNATEYKKLCDVAVTQLGLYFDPKVYTSMGYLIRLEDGTFVVIDGGKGFDYNAELLYNTMLEQKPDGIDDIVISAWIVTHGHGDHCGVFCKFAASYADKVKVRMMVGNDAPDTVYQCCLDGFVRHFHFAATSERFEGCVYMKAHAGQQFHLPGITLTVLYTHEDIFPAMMRSYNDTSLVVDVTVKGKVTKKAVRNGVTRFVFLADVHPDGAQRLMDMYEKHMKCDVMQIAHHGIGCYHTELYKLCNPKIAYWPCGKEVLEYKNGSRFQRPHIKYLVETTEQMIYQPDGNHTFVFESK